MRVRMEMAATWKGRANLFKCYRCVFEKSAKTWLQFSQKMSFQRQEFHRFYAGGQGS